MFLLSGTECRYTPLGKEYRGLKHTTVNNRICKTWGPDYSEGVLANDSNYCRNEDSTTGGPWCYTTTPGVSWEFCGIPMCGE